MSGEATSRARPGLPGTQRSFSRTPWRFGKPVIVVLTCGRPLIEPALFEKAGAVLVTWFAGSEAGNALADIVTGAANPSGRLPVSWPAEIGQIPIFYAQRRTGLPADPKAEQTSKYIDAPVAPLFPFGHGLSYTRFGYGKLHVSTQILRPGEVLSIEAEIENQGPVAGEETCFLFIHDVTASVARPVLELRGIAKIALDPGQRGTVRFELADERSRFPRRRRLAQAGAGRIRNPDRPGRGPRTAHPADRYRPGRVGPAFVIPAAKSLDRYKAAENVVCRSVRGGCVPGTRGKTQRLKLGLGQSRGSLTFK